MRKLVNSAAVRDRTGDVYGRLTVLHRDGSRLDRVFWVCKCECGNETSVRGDSLGVHSNSCGCLAEELAVKRWTTPESRKRMIAKIKRKLKLLEQVT